MTRPLKVYTVTDLDYLPGGFPIPPEAVMEAGAPDHVEQCRVIITALDSIQAENMLAQRGLRPSTSAMGEAQSFEVTAMREAGLFAVPTVWLLIWTAADLAVVQVVDDGNLQRVGRIAGAGGRAWFEAAPKPAAPKPAAPKPAAPAGIDRNVVDWTAKRHRDALASAITEAREDLSHLPTKLLRGSHISGELNGIIGRLVDAAGRARALEAIDEILPKN